jgi:uncharacterized protein with NAD-binding domain and iron-sulfur cluster
MDVAHARKVMVGGFLSNRTGFEMEIPLVPLGDLYGSRLVTWLREHGVSVQLATGVRAIDLDDDNALRGVILRSGDPMPADFVVLAVPFDRARSLIPAAAFSMMPELRCVDSLHASPITGVHLWFDRPVCPFDHVVTPGRLIQWVFNHTAIQGRKAARSTATHAQESAPRDAVLVDLAEIWPETTQARLLRSWVVTEHGATFAVRPGVDALRPPQRMPIDGLFLAGDWTRTGWPATMEGAVRSGYLAAEGILRDLDRPLRLVRPELKRGRLARWLLGPSTS